MFEAADRFKSTQCEVLVLNVWQRGILVGNLCNFYKLPRLQSLTIVIQSEKYIWILGFLETVLKKKKNRSFSCNVLIRVSQCVSAAPGRTRTALGALQLTEPWQTQQALMRTGSYRENQKLKFLWKGGIRISWAKHEYHRIFRIFSARGYGKNENGFRSGCLPLTYPVHSKLWITVT